MQNVLRTTASKPKKVFEVNYSYYFTYWSIIITRFPYLGILTVVQSHKNLDNFSETVTVPYKNKFCIKCQLFLV